MGDHSSLEILLDKYRNGTITDAERMALQLLLSDPDNSQHLAAIMDRELQEHTYEIPEDNALLSLIQHNLQQKIRPARRVRMLWIRQAAAAAVFVVLAGAGYYIWTNAGKNSKAPVTTPVIAAPQDIAPGSNKAILQLADGRKIFLDNAASGKLAEQGNTKVVKLDDGRLSYQAAGKQAGILYNTISTPIGGQYQLMLADGSRVWLNSASSLRFPASFTGKERIVELTGEGYFEIAKNRSMPFHVKANGADIQVLGTHFNVNAYSDEAVMATTLLEGSVTVKSENTGNHHTSDLRPHTSVILNPGQQAAIDKTGTMKTLDHVNVEEVVAWKNGLFHFEGATLQSVLRQASRWYDVQFEYRSPIDGGFSGEIPRNVNISQLLKILQLTGKVQFEIQGKTIIVQPKQS